MLEEEIAFEAEVFIGTSYSSMTGIIQQVGRAGGDGGGTGEGWAGGRAGRLWVKGPTVSVPWSRRGCHRVSNTQGASFSSKWNRLAACCLRPAGLAIPPTSTHCHPLPCQPPCHQERFARGIPTTKTYVFAHTGG